MRHSLFRRKVPHRINKQRTIKERKVIRSFEGTNEKSPLSSYLNKLLTNATASNEA